MTSRVDRLESDIGLVVGKIDGVFRKLHLVARDKKERRAAMDQIFDPARRDSTLGDVGK